MVSVAKIKIQCQCGKLIQASAGQGFRNNVLYWFLSYRCEHCGRNLEEDGGDDIHDEIRNAIIAQDGEWNLFVKDNEKKTIIKALLTIKEHMRLSINEISEMKKRHPTAILKGTKIEMQRLQSILQNNDFESFIEKV